MYRDICVEKGQTDQIQCKQNSNNRICHQNAQPQQATKWEKRQLPRFHHSGEGHEENLWRGALETVFSPPLLLVEQLHHALEIEYIISENGFSPNAASG